VTTGNFIEVQTTCDSEEEAKTIAASIVENRLAACVQVSPISSIYRWQGKIETCNEWLCIIKTTNERYPAVRDAILHMHSYECPQIITLAIKDGTNDYLSWIEEGVR
jgi:periplasmic divalent cation tolerance protein